MKEGLANYRNTLARRESNMFIQCWLKILNTQHFVNKAVKLCNLDNEAQCTETSVLSIVFPNCFL